VHGRIGFDYAPAQLQSYLNPLSFLPFYLLAKHLPAVLVGFIQGAAHGLLFGLVFAVARNLFDLNGVRRASALVFLCAVLGLWGPFYVGLVGTSTNDFLIAELVLAAILLVLRWWRRGDAETKPRSRVLLASGVVLGIASGLKMSAAIYAVGALIGLVALPMPWKARARTAGFYTAALAVGFLVAAGWWMIILQSRFGSPTFPFFNAIFQSPDYPATNFADKRYLPHGVSGALVHPVRIWMGTHHETGAPYRDARYFLLVLLALGAGARSAIGWLRRQRSRATTHTAALVAGARGSAAEFFLLSFIMVSYILWQQQFAILRYASALEAAVPIALVVLVHRITQRPTLRRLMIGAIAITIVASMRPIPHDRTPWFRESLHAVAPRFPDPGQMLVVIAHNAPWSYVLPALQPEIRVLNVRSNLTKPTDDTRFQHQMRDLIARHTGSIYLLTDSGYAREDAGVMQTHYALAPADETCAVIESRQQSIPIYLCRLQRMTP
jgi:hypothetical protein